MNPLEMIEVFPHVRDSHLGMTRLNMFYFELVRNVEWDAIAKSSVQLFSTPIRCISCFEKLLNFHIACVPLIGANPKYQSSLLAIPSHFLESTEY